MARQIIALEVYQPVPGLQTIKVAFWFPIAAGKEYKKPNFQSAVDANLAGAAAVTGPELTALQAGQVLEEVQTFTFGVSKTTVEIKAQLVQAYTDRATAVANLPNPIAYYGVNYNGVAWSA